jgi:hypothetical protein
MEVTNQQVLEWVEWAFTQEVRAEDTGLGRAIASLAEPTSGTKEISIEMIEELEDSSKTTIRPSAMHIAQPEPSTSPTTPRPKPAPTSKMRGQSKSSWWWVIFVLLVVGAFGTYVGLDFFGYEIDWSVFGQ